MVEEAVTAYSDPGKQTTIDEIVKLAAAKVPTLIGKLKEKGYLVRRCVPRPAPRAQPLVQPVRASRPGERRRA